MGSGHRKAGGGAVIYSGLLVVLHKVLEFFEEKNFFFIYFEKSIMNRIFKPKNKSVKGIMLKYGISYFARFIKPFCINSKNILLHM
jgi:hypothetical protein